MAINEWNIWQKIGIVKPRPKPMIDVEKDISAIKLFLGQQISAVNLRKLSKLFNELQNLRRNESALAKLKADPSKIKRNILNQVKVYDRILNEYEAYQLDADITGERVKKISKYLNRKAKDTHIDQKWLDKIGKSERWNFDW